MENKLELENLSKEEIIDYLRNLGFLDKNIEQEIVKHYLKERIKKLEKMINTNKKMMKEHKEKHEFLIKEYNQECDYEARIKNEKKRFAITQEEWFLHYATLQAEISRNILVSKIAGDNNA